MNKQTSQFGTSSHPSSNQTSLNCLSHNNPADGWPCECRSRGTTWSSMLAQDFGLLCRGRRVHITGHSDWGMLSNLGASSNFAWVFADTASAACPSQSGNLAITVITFAAVIWDADEPCSAKTAQAPSWSFTMLCLCTFVIWVPTPHSWGDMCPSMLQSRLPFFVALFERSLS